MLRHTQVRIPFGGMLRAMPKVTAPPLGVSLQVVGALLTLGALVVLIGLAWTALLGGLMMLVAGVFIESPELVRVLARRRARPAGD